MSDQKQKCQNNPYIWLENIRCPTVISTSDSYIGMYVLEFNGESFEANGIATLSPFKTEDLVI